MELSNRLGYGTLIGCATTSAAILALMFARQSIQEYYSTLDWLGDYLWIVVPYVALVISTAVAWRSRSFSGWILASVIIAMVTNPALYFLVYIVCGGHEDESNTWTLFAGPVMTWNVLCALLIAAVTVRVIQSFRRRSGSEARNTR